ncbi:MAG: OmpA family protein, partial [Bacteroidota bacterium]
SRIIEAWDNKYSFFCTRPGWESIVAKVVVDVDTHKGTAGGGDHMQTTVYKVPDSGTYNVGAFVQSQNDQDAHNNQMVLSSTHADANPRQNLLRRRVLFANNSAALDATAVTTLNQFAADFQDANLDLSNPVLLEGHASSSGSASYNQQLAQQRIEAVQNHLAASGFTGVNQRVSSQNEGETGATEDATWRRVDLIVGNGQGQIVAAHEMGHVFGVMDEYAINPGGSISGTGNPTGTIVGHDKMAKDIGTTGAVAENNDDIMSLGRVVRPKHYATFGWALSQLTGIHSWQVR